MDPVEAATSYLDALRSHDADRVSLAPDARRINNGVLTVEGADALRAISRREPVAATSAFRWLVDGDQAIVFYDRDADLARAQDKPPGPPETWIPAYIGERFQVRESGIQEIEVVYTGGPGMPRPKRPQRYPAGRDAREEVLAVAKAYVAALVSHDSSAVPIADEVWRIENGRDTADGADALRKSLESEIMHTIQGIDEVSWFAAGDSAAVFYTLHARAGERDMFMRIAERFRVVDGRLVEIEAVFAPKGS
ncbi:MAG: hypothetical protein O7G30_12730 [Proteobacteria bacterium]|nr:hypothetical protein [Pseudomonadota bacterium]